MLTARLGYLSGLKFLVKVNQSKAIWAAPILFIGALFYWPLAKLLSIGFSGNWIAPISTWRILSIFWFTIWQALLSGLICIALGIPGAYLFYTRRFPGQRALKAFITVPFVLPTIVVAIGFTSFRRIPLFAPVLLENSHIPIILLANIFMNYAIAVRIIGSTWRTLDASLEDAASLDGAGRIRTFIYITFPNLMGAITSALALIFLYCAVSFGIVLVLGGGEINTLETEIYKSATQYLDLQKSAGLVFLQSILTVLAFLLSRSKIENGLVESQIGQNRPNLDKRDLPAVALTFTFIIILLALPILKIFIEAFNYGGALSIKNFINLAGKGSRNILNISPTHAALNSLRNMVISSSISMGIGLIVSYLISRNFGAPMVRKFRIGLNFAFQVPIGISSVVLGFGYLITFSSGIFPLRSSWLVTPIVASLMATPLVIRLLLPALDSIDRHLLESASTEGASEPVIWRQIEAPIIGSAILTAVGFSALISIGEFGAANFLAYGDQATLPIILFQLISRPGAQNYGMAMAASSLLILFVALVIYLITLAESSGS